MALKTQILNGSIAMRVLVRSFMLLSALSIIPLLQILHGSDAGLLGSVTFHECGGSFGFSGTKLLRNPFLRPIWGSLQCKEDVNLTTNVVREIMGMQLLDYSAKSLCVGEASASAVYALQELGFANACGEHRYPFFSLGHRKFFYELQYADGSFDFVFSRDLDKVSVPASLVLEIERVLKPGGIGAMLVGASGLNPNNLIRSATPVSSLLKASSVVHVGYLDEYTLVVFKKRIDKVGYFSQFQLPTDCQSLVSNKPLMDNLEPLVEDRPVDFENRVAYLPKFMNVSAKKRLVYVDIGAGEHVNSSATNWFLPSYPVDQKAFSKYIVDHNTSVLLSCVKMPGVTFIYYPGLAGDNVDVHPDVKDLDPSPEDEGFDFLAWFKETVVYADFVVLKMKAGEVELKFLADLFRSRTICLVDEMFLSCSGHVDGEMGDCVSILQSLRSSGVFAHQWWGD